ncbi:HlyD family efflux transporter periplasmic adaptor subunit [Bordetella sp. 2513F-2]
MTRKRLLALVLVALVAVAGFYAWRSLRPGATDGELVLYGNVDIRQVSLAFEGSERVAEMRVEEGDRVSAGQVLALLDTRTLALQLARADAQAAAQEQALLALRNGSRPEEIAQARAQAGAAQAELERARLALKRLQATAASTGGRAVGAQDLDDARAQLRVAQAQLEARQQALKLAVAGPRAEDLARAQAQLQAAQAEQALLRHRIAQAELRAPQAAVVRSRLLEPGDMASPQRPAYTLALTDPKWVRAYVSEPRLGHVRPGMAARVYTDSAPDQPIAGRVGFISSVAEFTPKSVQTEALRTDLVYEIRILVDDPQDTLRLGMPATVRMALDAAPDAGRDGP